ncbi:unnamed protein product [Heligmosomoides polygyrus]|uniref:SAM_MT_RSMB_NOP domain-containing protein n=1 Tax=Heligmosomoides polygyrus TaxID=6339 RepID=A0A183FP20_HELPZ|nr:unnamed protein product [Heligmosomoides polygyrus]
MKKPAQPREDGPDGQRDDWRSHKPYKDIVKENEKYWAFYKAQKLVPEEEWDAFCTSLRSDLPTSFRVQGCHKDRDRLMHELETKFFIPIAQSKDSDVFEPKPLPWYPGAYQTRMTRTSVRSHPILAHLHNFLVTEAELGHISRQEAVSMIPPLLLNPESDHLVLDMCAAPGSKTAQLIEMMHENTPNPSGMLIANDVDKKRCYMLIHQTLKRFHTANCAVICEDAARLPVLKGKDEAVVAQLIRESEGTLRLVDTHPLLPKLRGLRGVSTWKVRVVKYSMRIVPHHQDTGGFFVALLEKVEEKSFNTAATVGAPAFKKLKMFKDEPFTFLQKDDDRWADIKGHYGIRDDFEYENLFCRRQAEHDVNCRQLFFANAAVKEFVQRNMTSVSIQNAGMKMFSRNEQKVEATRFRLSQEGIRHLLPYLGKQLVKIDEEDMMKILKTEETMIPLESLKCKEAVREQGAGSLVLYSDIANPVCTWVGFHTVAPYLCKEERVHMLRMMGVDCSEIEQMMKSKRKQKAAADRKAAWEAAEAEKEAAEKSVPEEETSNLSVTDGMRRELLGCGLSEDGQLGLGSRSAACVKLPEQIVGAPLSSNGTAVVSVACGEKHTLILADDGKMWSVGGNDHGQLGRGGRGSGSFTIYPVSFSGGVKMIQVAAGRAHSMSVAEDGRLFAWGSNEHGQLAMPRQISWQETPKRIVELTEVVQVACGPHHCIALLENGVVAVWGEQSDGAILHTPQIVTQLTGIPIVRVAAGGRHCVAVSAGGGVYVWGHNEYGQLGTGDTQRMSSMHIIEAYCGDSHTLLLSQEGRLFAFGNDAQGQIGGGRKFDKHTNPAAVAELMGSTVTRVACGRNHSVVVIGGRLYPFGQNAHGQLGNGSATNQVIPRQTDELDHVVAVFAGFDQTFLIRAVGSPMPTPGPNHPLKTPVFLSKTRVVDLLVRHEKLDLIGLLESALSSTSCINGSFLFEDEKRFLCEGRVFGVNLDDVMESFGAIGDSSDAADYANLVCSVQKKWWVTLPVRHFNRFVTAIMSAVRCLVKEKVNPDVCLPFLDILASLCAINKVANYIPLENFYIDDLAQNYNLKSDYVRWAHAQFGILKEGKETQVTCWSNYPFLMNGAAKGELLYVEAVISMQTSLSHARLNLFGFDLFIEQPFFDITVRRLHIVEDTINTLLSSEEKYLKRPLKVHFLGEEAEDAGGVKKEFFMILYGMFVEDPDSHLVWFSGYDVELLDYYKMIGILCGLAVYNSVLVDFPFPLALYKMLLDQKPTLEDLTELSPVEGRSLQALLEYQGDDFEDVFCLNFTISYSAFGSTETTPLVTGGEDKSVTQDNKAEYVQVSTIIHSYTERGRESNCWKLLSVSNSERFSTLNPSGYSKIKMISALIPCEYASYSTSSHLENVLSAY